MSGVEGDGLQAVRKNRKINAVLAAEGLCSASIRVSLSANRLNGAYYRVSGDTTLTMSNDACITSYRARSLRPIFAIASSCIRLAI